MLALETYRELRPVQCGWQITNRGLLLRLHKRTAGHWPRLLRHNTPDGKQGVDWTRWTHPEATRAEERDAQRAEFERLNELREREMRTLRPQFDHYLARHREVLGLGEILEPAEQKEMLRLGEAILTIFRSERNARHRLLGDKPLPAGIDEEQLERALLRLGEMRRKGSLEYDRNTDSWKEHRRRIGKRREKLGLDPATGQPLSRG